MVLKTNLQQNIKCTTPDPVDLKLAVVKPLGASWMIQLYDYF